MATGVVSVEKKSEALNSNYNIDNPLRVNK